MDFVDTLLPCDRRREDVQEESGNLLRIDLLKLLQRRCGKALREPWHVGDPEDQVTPAIVRECCEIPEVISGAALRAVLPARNEVSGSGNVIVNSRAPTRPSLPGWQQSPDPQESTRGPDANREPWPNGKDVNLGGAYKTPRSCGLP